MQKARRKVRSKCLKKALELHHVLSKKDKLAGFCFTIEVLLYTYKETLQ